MLLTKEVEIKPTNHTLQHYLDLGYDAKMWKPLVVKVEDLTTGSNAKVDVLCDYCKQEVATMPYFDLVAKNKGINPKHTCKKCKGLKIKESNQLIYGVDSAAQLEEVQQKIRKTNLERYGVPNYMQTKECQEKIKATSIERYGVEHYSSLPECREKMEQTMMERYGVKNPSQSEEIQNKKRQNCIDRYGVEHHSQDKNYRRRAISSLEEKYGVVNVSQLPEVREKVRQTCIDRYGVEVNSQYPEFKEKAKATCLEHFGVEYSMQSQEVREKAKQTNLEKYGFKYGLQSPEIREKGAISYYQNGTKVSSRQQRYLHRLYGGEINYPIKHYDVDICFPDEHLSIEYDGGGHDLNVKLGSMTNEKFKLKEIKRNASIKRAGYKQMRIISSKDLLPDDKILLDMLAEARLYFNNFPNHSWIEFNIDSFSIHNAEQKDGIYFDFGPLRRIKKNDISLSIDVQDDCNCAV